MIPYSLRIPADLVNALRLQAQARGLDLASHIRSQLRANLNNPVNILRPVLEKAS